MAKSMDSRTGLRRGTSDAGLSFPICEVGVMLASVPLVRALPGLVISVTPHAAQAVMHVRTSYEGQGQATWSAHAGDWGWTGLALPVPGSL